MVEAEQERDTKQDRRGGTELQVVIGPLTKHDVRRRRLGRLGGPQFGVTEVKKVESEDSLLFVFSA